MKNDFNIATSTGAPSTLVATEMTSGVIAGYKAYTNITPIRYKAYANTTPIHAATSSDYDPLRDIVARLSALERIQPSQIYKVENCPNCGGSMKLYADDHILKCQYCKSVVFVGIKNING